MPESQSDRLSLLYRISQTFNSSLELEDVLNSVIDEVVTNVSAERGFLMLRNAAGELDFEVARGIEQQTISAPEFEVSRGIVDRVAREGIPQLTSDAQSDKWLANRASVIGLGLRSVMCVPVSLKERNLGVIYVDNRLQAGIFTRADLDLLASIGSSAAAAIENARLYAVAIEKGRMERELQVARELQESLLPLTTPTVTGWDFAAHWTPAREVSGDFYDFLVKGDKLGVLIADVSDKGMAAALFMALSRSILRATLSADFTPAEAISRANKLITADSRGGMFVTLFYGEIDLASGELIYVNAGHNPPLLHRAGAQECIQLSRTGMLVGAIEEAEYQQQTIVVGSGDALLLYTDGLVESESREGAAFGEERMRKALLEHTNLPAAESLAKMLKAVNDFTGATAPFDDITAIAITRS